MCKRQRSPKPTVGPADLPFSKQRACNPWVPREKWSPLELKIWRLQQRGAERLRRHKRSQFKVYRRRGKWLHLYSKPRFAERFRRGASTEDEITTFEYGLREGSGNGLRSTVFRRAVQVATERVAKFATAPKRILSAVSGKECFLCSGPHISTDCLRSLLQELSREDEHIVIVRHRLALESNELVAMEETLRLASSLRRREIILRKRGRALAYVGWCIAKYGIGHQVLAPLRVLTSVGSLVADAFYIGTGIRFAVPTPFKSVFNYFWATKTLIEFAENIRAQRQTQALPRVEVVELEDVKVQPTTTTVVKPVEQEPLVSYIELSDEMHLDGDDVILDMFLNMIGRFADALAALLRRRPLRFGNFLVLNTEMIIDEDGPIRESDESMMLQMISGSLLSLGEVKAAGAYANYRLGDRATRLALFVKVQGGLTICFTPLVQGGRTVGMESENLLECVMSQAARCPCG